MAWLKRYVLPPLVTGVVLAIAGGIVDMRLSLMRLESTVQSMNSRTERIERFIDNAQRLSVFDPE